MHPRPKRTQSTLQSAQNPTTKRTQFTLQKAQRHPYITKRTQFQQPAHHHTQSNHLKVLYMKLTKAFFHSQNLSFPIQTEVRIYMRIN